MKAPQYLVVTLTAAVSLPGCTTGREHPATTQPATAIDPKTATPDYWYGQPATQAILSDNFDELWRAARNAVQADSFRVDRVDYRGGLITSFPAISKQFFEPWRQDAQGPYDVAESSLATIRRTVRLEFSRLDDGRYECVPKVLVERYSATEHRITSVTQYRDVFSIKLASEGGDVEQIVQQQAEYWYALRRDANLERQIAESIRDDLRSRG